MSVARTESPSPSGRELQVRSAHGFWQRFSGLMLTAGLASDRGLLLRRCASVHTCFMRYPIDIVYLDAAGKIVSIVPAVQPWRFSAGGRQAVHVLELAAGTSDRLGLRVGADLAHVLDQSRPGTGASAPAVFARAAMPGPRARRSRGTAMVEFIIVGPIITLLGLAILQYGMLFFAKNQINYAAFMAARAGSTGNAKMAGITAAYLKALIPLYGGGRDQAELTAAYAKAVVDTAGNLQVQVLNPTKESFDDFNDPNLEAIYGARAFSNSGQVYRSVADIRAASGQNLQDANLIKLRIVHGYAPKVPLIGGIYTRYLQWLDPLDDAFHTQLVAAGRIPVVTNVTLQMQSDPIEGVNVSTPGPGNNGVPSDPGDPPAGGAGDPPSCATIGCTVPSTPVDPGGGGGGGGPCLPL